MLFSVNELLNFNIQATDSAIGSGHDVLFDDRFWTCRFLAVDTNPWIPLSHKVLLSPVSVMKIDAEKGDIHVSLSREKIKSAPSTDTNLPVSREFERTYYDFMGYAHYWVGPRAWAEFAFPSALADVKPENDKLSAEQGEHKNHLRSTKEVTDYGIFGVDGAKGHVEDFIIDNYSWMIAFIVVDTRDWLPGGKKVLLKPQQLDDISWTDQALKCSFSIDALKSLPEYKPERLNDVDYLEKINYVDPVRRSL